MTMTHIFFTIAIYYNDEKYVKLKKKTRWRQKFVFSQISIILLIIACVRWENKDFRVADYKFLINCTKLKNYKSKMATDNALYILCLYKPQGRYRCLRFLC